MARVRALVAVVILIFGLAASSAAQGTGDIVGRVADASVVFCLAARQKA
jgi:hypothetical protein